MKMWMIGIGATLLIIASVIVEIIDIDSPIWVAMFFTGEIAAVLCAFFETFMRNH